MKASAILRRGRARLVRFGWCQDAYVNSDGQFCALGAAIGGDPVTHSDEELPGEMLALAIGLDDDLMVSEWNDDEDRSKADVLAAYDDAIAIAESAELTDRHFKEQS